MTKFNTQFIQFTQSRYSSSANCYPHHTMVFFRAYTGQAFLETGQISMPDEFLEHMGRCLPPKNKAERIKFFEFLQEIHEIDEQLQRDKKNPNIKVIDVSDRILVDIRYTDANGNKIRFTKNLSS